MTDPFNLVGKRFGLWSVVSKAPSSSPAYRYWLCKCGSEKIGGGDNLTSGASLRLL